MQKSFVISLILAILYSIHLYADEADTHRYDAYDYNAVLDKQGREGLTASLGLGVHATDFDFSELSRQKSKMGVVTSLKIGYNFKKQFALYYVRNASWYALRHDTYLSGIAGVGATFYFEPLAETLYASFALGVGDFTNVSKTKAIKDKAWMATIGYEFSPHWQAEATWLSTSILDKKNNQLNSSSLQLILNYSWY